MKNHLDYNLSLFHNLLSIVPFQEPNLEGAGQCGRGGIAFVFLLINLQVENTLQNRAAAGIHLYICSTNVHFECVPTFDETEELREGKRKRSMEMETKGRSYLMRINILVYLP